jgi:hypothetical protein
MKLLKKLTPMHWFVILAVTTAGLALCLPPDPQTLRQLHITSLVYRIAITLILVPFGIIWYTAFYAFTKLMEYSRAIKGSEDGQAFAKITAGMGVLAFGLVLPTTISLVLQNIAMHHQGFKAVDVIVTNYLNLLVLASFLIIGNGTRLLANMAKYRPSLAGIRFFALLFISLSVLFTYLVIHFHEKHPDVYYLPTPLLLTTFIIPYLFGWFMALLSAYEFGLYAKYAKGLLYRQALRKLAQGIVVTILGSVVVQFVTSTVALKYSHSLGSLLAIEYILLLIIAVGLTLMALGTKKLKKIEEV